MTDLPERILSLGGVGAMLSGRDGGREKADNGRWKKLWTKIKRRDAAQF